jgi:hypothetical protein
MPLSLERDAFQKADFPSEARRAWQPFLINAPSTPSAPSTWSDPAAIAQLVPGGEAPKSLNGLELSPRGRCFPGFSSS